MNAMTCSDAAEAPAFPPYNYCNTLKFNPTKVEIVMQYHTFAAVVKASVKITLKSEDALYYRCKRWV